MIYELFDLVEKLEGLEKKIVQDDKKTIADGTLKEYDILLRELQEYMPKKEEEFVGWIKEIKYEKERYEKALNEKKWKRNRRIAT